MSARTAYARCTGTADDPDSHTPQCGRNFPLSCPHGQELITVGRTAPPQKPHIAAAMKVLGIGKPPPLADLDLPGHRSEWTPPPPPPSVSMADIAAAPVDWLWQDYIPAGMLTVIDGDPGLGKSWLTCDLAARVTRGLPMPPLAGSGDMPPAGVLLCNAEDDPARTIRPRLDAAGADLARVHLPDLRDTDGRPRPVVLPDDLDALESIVAAHGVRLVVIDPLMAFLNGQVNSHRDSDIRRVSARLKDLAERTGAAVVLIRHLNKMSAESNPLYRGGGSIGIIGAARAAFLVGAHPDDPSQRVLARLKGNLCAPPPALAFRIDGHRIGWVGEVDFTAADLLARPPADRGRPADASDKAQTWLAEYLAGGERLAREVEAAARREGISSATLRRAKESLGVVARPPISRGGPWTWTLPQVLLKNGQYYASNFEQDLPDQAKTKGIQVLLKNPSDSNSERDLPDTTAQSPEEVEL